MSNLKKIIFVFICISTAIGGTYAYFKTSSHHKTTVVSTDWQAYSPKNKRFSIKFPLNPKESREEMKIKNKQFEFQQFSAEDKNTFYAVSYLDFPSRWKWIGSQKLLVKSFEMIIENEPNIEKILKKELTYHHRNPALIYKIKQDGKEIYGKFVLSGTTLYRVAVTYPQQTENQIHSNSFIDSFEIKT